MAALTQRAEALGRVAEAERALQAAREATREPRRRVDDADRLVQVLANQRAAAERESEALAAPAPRARPFTVTAGERRES